MLKGSLTYTHLFSTLIVVVVLNIIIALSSGDLHSPSPSRLKSVFGSAQHILPCYWTLFYSCFLQWRIMLNNKQSLHLVNWFNWMLIWIFIYFLFCREDNRRSLWQIGVFVDIAIYTNCFSKFLSAKWLSVIMSLPHVHVILCWIEFSKHDPKFTSKISNCNMIEKCYMVQA